LPFFRLLLPLMGIFSPRKKRLLASPRVFFSPPASAPLRRAFSPPLTSELALFSFSPVRVPPRVRLTWILRFPPLLPNTTEFTSRSMRIFFGPLHFPCVSTEATLAGFSTSTFPFLPLRFFFSREALEGDFHLESRDFPWKSGYPFPRSSTNSLPLRAYGDPSFQPGLEISRLSLQYQNSRGAL